MPHKTSQSLASDYVEGIDFLLAQRTGLFHDPEVEWPRIADFEDRLMAHVDGIVVGGKKAVDLAAEIIAAQDENLLTGAIFGLLYSESKRALDIVFDGFSHAGDELIPAYAGSLKFADNGNLAPRLAPLLNSDRPLLVTTACATLGYRREGRSEQFKPLLKHPDPSVVRSAIMAIGCCEGAPQNDLFNLCKSQESHIASAAARVLVEQSHREVRDFLRARCSEELDKEANWPVWLALIGDSTDSLSLLRSTHARQPKTLSALGMLGNVGVVPHLIDCLTDKDEAVVLAAAGALDLVTGASLRETYTYSEEWPAVGGDEPESEEVSCTRIATNPEVWASWWNEHKSNFGPGEHWRLGEKLSKKCLIDEIALPTSSYNRRMLAYSELKSRYGAQVAFEADWFVDRQMEAISKMRQTL